MRNTHKLLCLFMVLAAAGGCQRIKPAPALSKTPGPYETPLPVFPTPTEQPERLSNDGSLFQPEAGIWSFWGDDTARRLGDIVTVRVQVNHSAEKSATTDLSRESDLSAGITALLGYEADLPGVGSGNPLSNTSPEQLLRASSRNSFKGDGDTRRSDKIVADISAQVMHVYPNGNMLIHGSQSLLVNNENSLLTVDGVIRPSDISFNNVVLSNRIAQCRVEITGRGVISDKQKPGILSRAVDWLWPL